MQNAQRLNISLVANTVAPGWLKSANSVLQKSGERFTQSWSTLERMF